MFTIKKILILLTLSLFSLCCIEQSRYVSQSIKKVVYTRDGGLCQCCGNYDKLEYDHIEPFSCGGGNDVSNIQLLCRRCNRSKSNSCYCKVHNKKVGINCCSGETTKTKTTSISSRQCSGTTKKGVRCRIRTKHPSGLCHYHQ